MKCRAHYFIEKYFKLVLLQHSTAWETSWILEKIYFKIPAECIKVRHLFWNRSENILLFNIWALWLLILSKFHAFEKLTVTHVDFAWINTQRSLNGLKIHVYISLQHQLARISHSGKKSKVLVKIVCTEKSETQNRLQRNT